MKRQIAFPLVLSITILLLLGGMLYAILAAPTQSSKKLAMTSKHQPTPKITATAANKASAEPTMPNDTPAPKSPKSTFVYRQLILRCGNITARHTL